MHSGVFPIILITYGVLFNYPDGYASEPWRDRVVILMLAAQGLFSLLVIIYSRLSIIYSTSIMVFLMCLSLVAGLEVSMMVTNKWL